MAELDIQEVLRLLPQRYPMLMIDRVLEMEPLKRVRAVKNVSGNEPYFAGHFPGRPIMPGVLILEAMAQAAGILAFGPAAGHDPSDHVYYYVGIDNARFKKVVIPGDQLKLDVTMTRKVRGIAKFLTIASVGEEVVAEAELLCTIKEE